MVQALLEDAEDQQATDTTVRIWLSKLKDVASDAEDLLMDFTIRDSTVYTRNASEVTKILKVLETTIDEGFRLNLREGSMVHREWDGRETSSFVVESEVYGREEDKEKIVELLLSCKATQVGKASSISIVGMGGIGKTTLAQLVYGDERVTQHFDVKVWVFVSNQFDVKNIMVAVIESVTKEKCRILNMDALHSAVWSLLHRKRYLIVLDDVWIEKPEDLDKLKPLFRGGIDGSKILITTRSRKVAFMLESPSFSCHLNGLSEDACWSLFVQRAFQQGEEELHPALLPIGQQIVRKCGGLPLAAKALGSLMRFKREIREWLFVRDSELWNLDECESGILSALRLSYFHLPPHLKRCLVFCSIFPRHYEIKKDKLIQLWMAEGLVQSSSRKPPEDIGNDYFNNLLWMSFFIEIKRCDNGVVMGHKMHDVIYDFVQSVAGLEYAILDCQLLAPRSFRQIRHSSIVCNFKSTVIPIELCDAKHLRTLLLFSGGTFEELPHECYSNFKYLLVLDLCGSNLVDIDASIGHVSCLC
ncbi:NB-ARC domain, LRR domain containing protein [Trema orientale]|uniref:NB-ARC domain, LRR domain containing protein n=1 Tax=Trema orientale TaxID=63057 RepID=A0A2P5F7F6_TREOI|nr:NB-ARC domain, LRR domain containing protein [Trema orientale]